MDFPEHILISYNQVHEHIRNGNYSKAALEMAWIWQQDVLPRHAYHAVKRSFFIRTIRTIAKDQDARKQLLDLYEELCNRHPSGDADRDEQERRSLDALRVALEVISGQG